MKSQPTKRSQDHQPQQHTKAKGAITSRGEGKISGVCSENADASAVRYLFAGTRASFTQLRSMMGASTHWVGAVLVGGQAGESIDGVAVLGDIDAIASVLSQQAGQFEIVLVSLPSAMVQHGARLSQALATQGVAWRWMPTLSDQLAGRVAAPRFSAEGANSGEGVSRAGETAGGVSSVSSAATLSVAGGTSGSGGAAAAGLSMSGLTFDPLQLIGRGPAQLDDDAIRESVGGKVVMITGAGGSIGSELARVLCRYAPRKLLLVERSENSLFEIDKEIERIAPEQKRVAVLHDVTDPASTIAMVSSHRPQVIFHAAAHKHVPMMEDHPAQAVENNFYGTRSIAEAAAKISAERFVMISTDKAVNPSSVMGATKRLAELYIQYMGRMSKTKFSMVRFGNVLGSACSVLPIWTKQLTHGGPITVTDPNMTRYFMTIPEAAGLVIQSAAYAGASGAPSGGEVFLLDMGDPINIHELAQRFVRSQGLEPNVDVAITFTGARPGEKLFEELAYDSEGMLPTPHPSIRLWQTPEPDPQQMVKIIAAFDRLRAKADRDGHYWQLASREAIIEALEVAVPEMRRPDTVGAVGAASAASAKPKTGKAKNGRDIPIQIPIADSVKTIRAAAG